MGAEKATVTIKNPSLKANATTKITITVKAENGDTKTYKISVWRAQDPNYVASSNNTLKDIQVDNFPISPVFDSEITEYIVWLPYETEQVTIAGTADDHKATVEVYGGNDLVAGEDNEITVVCTAEDGTQKTYTIIAKRAAAHDHTEEPADPAPTDPQSSQPAPTEPIVTDPPATQPAPSEPISHETPAGCNCPSIWIIILILTLCVTAGLAVGILIGKKKSA